MLPFLHGLIQDVATTASCVATDSILSPSVGNTYIHQANCVIEYTIGTKPSPGNMIIGFRMQDINNLWDIRHDTSGKFQLVETVSGTPASRASTTGVALNGVKIIVVCSGTTITGYYGPSLTEVWSYSSASNFQTETDGKYIASGTGGSISNLVAWPYLCGLAEVGLV